MSDEKNGTNGAEDSMEEAKKLFDGCYNSVLKGLTSQEKLVQDEQNLVDMAMRIAQRAVAMRMALFNGSLAVAQQQQRMPAPQGTGHPGMMMQMQPGAMGPMAGSPIGQGYAPPGAYAAPPGSMPMPPGVVVTAAPSHCLICGQSIRGPSMNPNCKDNHIPPPAPMQQ